VGKHKVQKNNDNFAISITITSLTVGVLIRGGGLLSRFFDCRSNRIDGATVVGGAGVAIGTRVPSCGDTKGELNVES